MSFSDVIEIQTHISHSYKIEKLSEPSVVGTDTPGNTHVYYSLTHQYACVNCRRIYNETGIKTPHWWFGNRGTCCFPGGARDQMLGRSVRIIPDGILSNIFRVMSSSDVPKSRANGVRCRVINASVCSELSSELRALR